MLKPSMQDLMKRVGNRYLLVNLAALDEIAAGEIVYRPGPRTEPVIVQNNPIAAAMVDVDDSVVMDEDEQHEAAADEENEDEDHRIDEFDDHELDDGDVPEEDR